MNLEKFLDQIDIEEIYKTILDLEKPKHPLYNWDDLEAAAEYIKEKMESYGMMTEFHEFYIEGFDKPFKNVLGYIGDQNKPAIVLGSHYDTVIDTPGANDNLSGVAVSLEIARILSQIENPPSVIIAVFTLEEGHPYYYKRLLELMRPKGWLDNRDRLTSLKMLRFNRKVSKLVGERHRKTRKLISIIYEELIEEHKNDFSENELEYVIIQYEVMKELENIYKEPKVPIYALVGSTMFVNKVLKENINVKSIINLDTLGWISDKQGSQKPLPITKEMLPLTTCYKMEIKGTIGNFITVVANQSAKRMLDDYLALCSKSEIDMPCFGLYMPFDLNTIYYTAPDTLRSDHTPFWAENIPGIFITDTANFRSPYYHTAEDKRYHINYEALEKITKAILGTILI
ncbi:M28 family peptidase [Candidatus Izemoplasma sp. B36]|uniref:M28 family peptidase n=1 Tax=Candidatus Izemoplasma sp. B36 TaxID=3242468 RepID=UPI003558F67D